MKHTYIFILSAICCISCVRNTSKVDSASRPVQLNDTLTYYSIKDNIIPVDFDKPAQVSVFDYFKSIELIPLEVNDDVLIGQLRKIIFYQDRYYTLDRQQHIVHVFNRQGKFIFKIDKRGQGPGEYPFLDDIAINASGNLDLLCAMGFVYEYDLKGKFIKMAHVTSDYLRAVHEFIPLDENTTLFYAASHHPYRVVYYDLLEKKIRKEEFKEPDEMGTMFNYSNFYQYKGEWHFYRPFCQDVYKVSENDFAVSFTLDFGKYNRDFRKTSYSAEARHNHVTRYDEVTNQIPYWLSEMGENNRYVIVHIKLNGKFTNVMYDKAVQQCKYIPRFIESVIIRPLIVTNEYVLNYCNPGELEQYLTEDMLDEPNRKIFNELIHSTEANPIIIKYHFK